MESLPTLRTRIFRAFSLLGLLYLFLGVLLMIAMFSASGTSPKMIHVNYDSIAAAAQMRAAWNALARSEHHQTSPKPELTAQFEKALILEEHNISEPGESKIAQRLRKAWDNAKVNEGTISDADYSRMEGLLDQLVSVNERGMFSLAEQNMKLSHDTFIAAIIYFLLSLFVSLLLADRLADRLARPLKAIAETLHLKPGIGKRIKFPKADSLEVLILTSELERLWDRVGESEKFNVAEILKEKTKLETVLESVEDALVVIDRDGKISHCNDCMQNLLGLPLQKIMGQLWRDLPTSNENYMKLRSVLHETMPDSQEFDLMLSGVPHQFAARSRKISANHEPMGVLYLLHDITEKKQRDKFRADFINLLSHELKTPLQSLGTASEYLVSRKDQFPREFEPFLETLSEDVERIRAVANEFVQITQSHSKILKLKLEMLALNQAVPEWIKPFKIIAKDRNVNLEFKHEGSDVIWARIDSVKFPWVISNLLSNAIRFSPKEGTVTVLLTDRNGAAEIQVKDQGPGVSEEDQRKIFEPFFQSPMNTASGAKGLFGIGLTITKEVVEAHDGRIEYYPREPHGSEFRIILPFPPLNYS